MTRDGQAPTDRRWMRPLLIAAGSLALGLGIIGVFLPVLPTTPFLLLAAACYVRSSPELYDRLLRSRWLGKYIRDYREKRGIPATTKVLTISALWLTIGYSALFVVDGPVVRILLLLIALAVTAHLLSLRTLRH